MSKKQNFSLSKLLCHKRKSWFVEIAIIVIVICLCVWDYVDPPLWWQFDRQTDKEAIAHYVSTHYEDGAKFIRSYFPILNPGLVGVPEDSVMYYEYNGIEFGVFAKNGIIVYDGYNLAKSNKVIDDLIYNEFIGKRNIEAEYHCDFKSTPSENLQDYYGDVDITITCNSDSNFAKPNAIKWFYDFYVYWVKESPLKCYDIHINFFVSGNSYYKLHFNEQSVYKTEDIFYSEFKYISYID